VDRSTQPVLDSVQRLVETVAARPAEHENVDVLDRPSTVSPAEPVGEI
jgi:hypothetical protein